jgi:hypothetical protein
MKMRLKKIIFSLLIISFSFSITASEAEITKVWCDSQKGLAEIQTKDKTFVDCLTSIYSVEAEYDYNWKEAIGQSLHYAETTGKEAAILLIIRKKSNKNYLNELERVIDRFDLPITIFTVSE